MKQIALSEGNHARIDDDGMLAIGHYAKQHNGDSRWYTFRTVCREDMLKIKALLMDDPCDDVTEWFKDGPLEKKRPVPKLGDGPLYNSVTYHGPVTGAPILAYTVEAAYHNGYLVGMSWEEAKRPCGLPAMECSNPAATMAQRAASDAWWEGFHDAQGVAR